MSLALHQPQLEAITAACRRHHVARLHTFGSVLRPDYRPGESDIDLLVEFQPDQPGALYKTYFSLLNELRQSLASRIDLVMVDASAIPTSKHRSRPASSKCMQRDPRAYLNDILEAAAAIEAATAGLDGESYGSNRLIRSAVEREFIIIGEALRVISQ